MRLVVIQVSMMEDVSSRKQVVVCVCSCVYMCACVYVCMHVCIHVHVSTQKDLLYSCLWLSVLFFLLLILSLLSCSPLLLPPRSDPPVRSLISDSGQSRREKFRQQKQKEMEVDVLLNIMKFVEDFLHNPSIWVFDNKEQNLLIYEVLLIIWYIVSNTYVSSKSHEIHV